MTIHEADVVIVGSGFGGTMMAHKMSQAGKSVIIIERGDWVKRGPENWGSMGSIDLTPNYDKSNPYRVIKGGNKPLMGAYTAVGGPSLFYGGVSFRMREADFDPPEDIVGDSGASWPISYNDLEKYYGEAEHLLNIAGESGIDPTEPSRSSEFPQRPAPYADISTTIKDAAESLGLHPFHLPLAINYQDTNRAVCQLCTTCDTFACAISAKNDLDTMLLKKMSEGQVKILANTIVHRLDHEGSLISEIQCLDLRSDEKVVVRGRQVVLSAGALASPHILLNSELDKVNPAGSSIGRYLMRHTNAIVFGIFPGTADKQKRYHKELAIMDYYLGHPSVDFDGTRIGSLQQVPTPPRGLVEREAPKPLGKVLGMAVKLITGLLAIAEDQPQYQNYIKLNHSLPQKNGMAAPEVSHEYSDRDQAAIKVLIDQAKKIMKASGALSSYVHHIRTFSHTVGTVRMGDDHNTAPLDRNCKFRGLDNLYVVDGSFMPTSAAVNPSLTISANALRVAEHILVHS